MILFVKITLLNLDFRNEVSYLMFHNSIDDLEKALANRSLLLLAYFVPNLDFINNRMLLNYSIKHQ